MSTRARTALASMARGILRWAERNGIDGRDLLAAEERERIERATDAARIPTELHVSLWTSIGTVLADPAFGLKSASAIVTASSLGIVGLMAMTSRNVGESLARSVRYSRILKNDVFARMHTGEREVVVELWSAEAPKRPIADASLFTFRHYVEQWTGESVSPRSVFFRHARPVDARDYELFGCPVHFEHAVDAIVFGRELCDVPLVTARPEITAFLEPLADARLREVEQAGSPETMRVRAAAAMREALCDGRTDARDVARRMGMSVRTLQRALAAHGVSYREVLDEVRWAMAAPLVAATDLSLEQIAERLGYADGKAFRRAFRRWSGQAPVAVRRRRFI